jgi:hypothetical protein
MQRILRELTATIGFADTMQLVRRWGGRTLAVPMKVDMMHPLALSIGLEAAQRLVSAYAGQHLQLPAERNALLDQRNAAIWRAIHEEGRSQVSVAIEFGLTRQGIQAVLAKMRDLQTVAGGVQAADKQESVTP